MTMICSTPSEAVAGIADGSTVLIGGFGMAGMPVDVVDALIKPGASDLTVVSNNAGNGEERAGRAPCQRESAEGHLSFPRQVDSWVFDGLYFEGRIELKVVPQGTLEERLRGALG